MARVNTHIKLRNLNKELEQRVASRTAELTAALAQVKQSQELTEDAESVVVKIKDNGKGICEDVKAHIFDHLFTTKLVGQGTGLGLSISRRIVEEIHGGSLTCYSMLGDGTEFAIALPIK